MYPITCDYGGVSDSVITQPALTWAAKNVPSSVPPSIAQYCEVNQRLSKPKDAHS